MKLDTSPELQAERGRKGGPRAAEAHKRNNTLRKALRAAMEVYIKNRQGDIITSPDTGEPLSRMEATAIKLAVAAAEGDIKAVQIAAKILGEYDVNLNVKGDLKVSAMMEAVRRDPYTYLYRPFSETYQAFFFSNRNSRHVLLQGGRRSGKTQATIRHLLRLCAAVGGDNKIMVVCYQHPQLLKTIEDFKQITGLDVHADQATTEGATWQFCNFDEYTKAQGSQCDYLFINEAVNVPEDIGDVLILGTRKQIFYNYNPTKSSWVSKHVADDGHNLLCTTFRDNSYLPPEQVAEFEKMRERAMLPTATMHDKYMYEVYYLGNFATMVGQVFNSVQQCSREAYSQIPAEEVYGLDFGFATDGDPTVLVGVKIADNKIYVRQLIYERGLVSDELLTRRMEAHGLNQYCDIRADYGGMGKGRIANLRNMGWSVAPCYKTTRLDGLSQMLCYDSVVVVEGGDLTLQELVSLELDEAQKTRGNDHAIDAIRYAFIRAKVM